MSQLFASGGQSIGVSASTSVLPVNIVVRPNSLPLKGTTFVVFDTETTGFNAAGEDQMIEIGAVKICDGNIIDSIITEAPIL